MVHGSKMFELNDDTHLSQMYHANFQKGEDSNDDCGMLSASEFSFEDPKIYELFPEFCLTSLATALHSSVLTPAPVKTCIHSLCVSLK